MHQLEWRVAVCITGRDSVGTRVWVGLLLWATMCVGELRLVSQSVLAMYLWIALFTLPYLYRRAVSPCATFAQPALTRVSWFAALTQRLAVYTDVLYSTNCSVSLVAGTQTRS